jgi:hypothetical protein
MWNTRKIIDFFIFRVSFEIETKLDQGTCKKLLIAIFNRDNCFINPVFRDYKFAFSHKNFMPGTYNFSPFYFDGEIKSGLNTSIYIKSGFVTIFFWMFIIPIIMMIVLYFFNYGNIRSIAKVFPLPIFLLVYISFNYIYYAYKIYDVKGIIRRLIKTEERKLNQK